MRYERSPVKSESSFPFIFSRYATIAPEAAIACGTWEQPQESSDCTPKSRHNLARAASSSKKYCGHCVFVIVSDGNCQASGLLSSAIKHSLGAMRCNSASRAAGNSSGANHVTLKSPVLTSTEASPVCERP